MSRMMPTECRHGFVVDWGDFGECQNCDEHDDGDCPNLAECPECWAEKATPPGVKRWAVTFDVEEGELELFFDWFCALDAGPTRPLTFTASKEQA